ncbi:PAS domain S-box protein [Vandammella animalimorsus]|uniref:PAS domain-containing sensor histidine kinase n=1 Tax=Vandammella animalimorsus TaxID=2029117 RepID=UPI0031BA4F62
MGISPLPALRMPETASPLHNPIRAANGKKTPTWLRLERLSVLIPLLSVVLFVLVMVGAYGFLRSEEQAREKQLLQQHTQFLLLRLNEQLLSRQDQIQRLVLDMLSPNSNTGFDQGSRTLIGRDRALYALTWFDASQRVVSSHHSAMVPSSLRRNLGQVVHGIAPEDALQSHWRSVAGQEQQSQEVHPAVLQFFIPIAINGHPLGAVMAEYAPHLLLNAALNEARLTNGLAVSLLDAQGQLIAGAAPAQAADATASFAWDPAQQAPTQLAVPVQALGGQWRLNVALYRSDRDMTTRALSLLLLLLGLSTVGMLWMNWRLSRRRLQTQRHLRQEYNFRLAIENALTTGIRALDMQGTTTYTNAAFSRMVGWSQDEMVGMKAPFPYWPRQDREILQQRFQAELDGRHYPGGLQLRMRRKNGTSFDARVFLTPLRDESGTQVGWLTTINDITEPNRIRQQLATAHERFTLVLESLDASISITPLGSKELLFANRLYRQWFGTHSAGHLQMLAQAGEGSASQAQQGSAEGQSDAEPEDLLMGLPADMLTSASSERAEIYVESLGKWLEVRSRYLEWVDGRLAQMLIATDISKRKQAEEQASRQIQKMESVNRLMTMGEMASSVAHELNQPLAAISNYVGGMIARIQSNSIEKEQLLLPLEKTAHQAVRAGQVIHRIRSFVQRSQSQREPCQAQRLVGEAVELANIEIRRRNVRLSVQTEAHLPPLHADAILIEQVLINLLKNAAEAIDGADLPPQRRGIELIVHRDGTGLRFRIADQGPGLPEEVLQHLFDAFYSTKQDGMGIGLNLCRSIIESHQGKMQVRNLYNDALVTGCEFSFWLPAAQNPHAPEDGPADPILG